MSATTLSNRQQLVKVVLKGALGMALLVGWPAVSSAQSVVIYENPNFGGRSQTLDVGGHILSDFNDIASSIRIPTGLVALLYEDVDAGGGYGLSVDLLEDRPDLSQMNFNDKLSYVCVFFSTTPQGFIWARTSVQNGQSVAGHWERQRVGGTPVNITAVVSPPLLPHPASAPPASCGGGPIVVDHRPGHGTATPDSILGTTYQNPPFDTSKQSWPHWANEAVHGKAMFPDWADANIIPGTRIFSSPDYSKNEWTQLLNQDEDYEVDAVGVSGRAIIYDLDGKNGQSGGDVPFTHPFGPDWEFYIAPDAAYHNLAAPPAPRPYTHREYAQSVIEAKRDFNLDVVNTLGVEMEQDLIPLPYRPHHGDRVAVWGRWIVDTGHPDFHTEIHPPLLLATGRATSPDETTTTVIGRPYLVGQRWPGGLGMIDHLLEEADKIPVRSLRAEAHPTIMPKAFTGLHSMSYTVRPPSPRRTVAGHMAAETAADRLMVSFHFTVRTGVAVQVVNSGDAVTVNIVMNSNVNKRAPLPPRHDVSVSREDLKRMDPRAGELYLAREIRSGIETLGVGAALLAKGVLTDRYDAPYAHSAHDSEIIHVPVDSLSGTRHFSVDDSQPFPIYGHLTLTWERGGATGGALISP